MVKENNRKKYQPPLVDLLECRVERGFWGSWSSRGLEGFSYGNYYGSPSGTGSGRAEGFGNGNSYGGAKFN